MTRAEMVNSGECARLERYMVTSEVADLLRVPAETVRYWRHISAGPRSFKVGRRVLYARDDVEAFIAGARAIAE